MAMTPDEKRIVDWLRGMTKPTAPKLFTLRQRLFYAWWALRNPSVSMVAVRVAIVNAIEAGDHRKDHHG